MPQNYSYRVGKDSATNLYKAYCLKLGPFGADTLVRLDLFLQHVLDPHLIWNGPKMTPGWDRKRPTNYGKLTANLPLGYRPGPPTYR